jgi:hypothetical protein
MLSTDILKNSEGDLPMTKSVRLLLMGAALTGFMAGQTAVAQAAGGDDAKKDTTAAKGDKATKGKNDCKGKGECRTDGKPMPKEGDSK